MAEPTWLSAHVIHHGDHNRLLTDGISPLLAGLSREGVAGESFFLRYWDGGPHIRLRIRPERQGDAPAVEERIRVHLTDYLRAHPSPARMSQQEYDLVAPELAAAEKMSGFTRRLYPCDSVVFVPYRREYDRYGHGASMAAAERHFTESSALALALLNTRPAQDTVISVACSLLMIATLLTGVPPTHGGGRHDALYTEHAPRLTELARRSRQAVARLPAPHSQAPLARWGRTFLTLRAATRPATGVVDLCAHLACNRLGVDVPTEMTLRSLTNRALGAPADKVTI
jgi:hypothetical protein